MLILEWWSAMKLWGWLCKRYIKRFSAFCSFLKFCWLMLHVTGRRIKDEEVPMLDKIAEEFQFWPCFVWVAKEEKKIWLAFLMEELTWLFHLRFDWISAPSSLTDWMHSMVWSLIERIGCIGFLWLEKCMIFVSLSLMTMKLFLHQFVRWMIWS